MTEDIIACIIHVVWGFFRRFFSQEFSISCKAKATTTTPSRIPFVWTRSARNRRGARWRATGRNTIGNRFVRWPFGLAPPCHSSELWRQTPLHQYLRLVHAHKQHWRHGTHAMWVLQKMLKVTTLVTWLMFFSDDVNIAMISYHCYWFGSTISKNTTLMPWRIYITKLLHR